MFIITEWCRSCKHSINCRNSVLQYIYCLFCHIDDMYLFIF